MSCRKSQIRNFDYNRGFGHIIDDFPRNREETENGKSASHDYPFFRGYFWGCFGGCFRRGFGPTNRDKTGFGKKRMKNAGKKRMKNAE